jgi:hypothetical protein
VRFFRGISVPTAKAENVITSISCGGLNRDDGKVYTWQRPVDSERLFQKCDLSRRDTQGSRESAPVGKRSLGYRGAGLIEQNLTGLHFERGPEVHDENRPQWTPMNATDRPDIRKRINDLAIAAAKKLVESGEDKFEHTI